MNLENKQEIKYRDISITNLEYQSISDKLSDISLNSNFRIMRIKKDINIRCWSNEAFQKVNELVMKEKMRNLLKE